MVAQAQFIVTDINGPTGTAVNTITVADAQDTTHHSNLTRQEPPLTCTVRRYFKRCRCNRQHHLEWCDAGKQHLGSSLGAATLNSRRHHQQCHYTVGGTLNVTDTTTTTDGITNTGNISTDTLTTTSGDATIGGNTTVDGTLGVTGATTLSSTLDARGAISNNSVAHGGAVYVNDAFTVTGATTTAGIANTGTLSSTGGFSVNTDRFTVDAHTGNTAVGGALDVTGLITGNGGATIAGTTNINAAGSYSTQIGGVGSSTVTLTSGSAVTLNSGTSSTIVTTTTGNTITGTTNAINGATSSLRVTDHRHRDGWFQQRDLDRFGCGNCSRYQHLDRHDQHSG